jgi:hypothetical protein
MSDPFAGATLNEPRFLAAVKLIERTGATGFRIGHTDEEEDGLPVIWHATATYAQGYEVAASLSPVEAVLRLCEQLIDGGQCRHCGQNTIFDPDPPSEDHLTELLDRMGCRYAWDPELATFRRSCEGADR